MRDPRMSLESRARVGRRDIKTKWIYTLCSLLDRRCMGCGPDGSFYSFRQLFCIINNGLHNSV